jgi:hypothetical protein
VSNYPFETFPLTKKIGIVNPIANLDARYGPWPTYNDALTAFSPLVRENGLTVAVSGDDGSIVEYWYRDGVADNNLVLKSNAQISVTDLNITTTFTDLDSNKIFHFDTTTQPLSAIFPDSLSNGFNVAVMNTGTNNLVLSASQLNSVGTTIGARYGGAFVYKDNSQLFAVGRL